MRDVLALPHAASRETNYILLPACACLCSNATAAEVSALQGFLIALVFVIQSGHLLLGKRIHLIAIEPLQARCMAYDTKLLCTSRKVLSARMLIIPISDSGLALQAQAGQHVLNEFSATLAGPQRRTEAGSEATSTASCIQGGFRMKEACPGSCNRHQAMQEPRSHDRRVLLAAGLLFLGLCRVNVHGFRLLMLGIRRARQ